MKLKIKPRRHRRRTRFHGDFMSGKHLELYLAKLGAPTVKDGDTARLMITHVGTGQRDFEMFEFVGWVGEWITQHHARRLSPLRGRGSNAAAELRALSREGGKS